MENNSVFHKISGLIHYLKTFTNYCKSVIVLTVHAIFR